MIHKSFSIFGFLQQNSSQEDLCSSDIYVNMSVPYYKQKPRKDQSTQYYDSETPEYVKPSEVRMTSAKFAQCTSLSGVLFADQAKL